MLKCYVDDSGSDERPGGLFVLAGYIMEEARWEAFAEDWHSRLHNTPAIDYFHMADAEAAEGLFLNMRYDDREFKVRSLANVIQRANPIAIEARMGWDDYLDIVDGKVDPRLNNPYAFLFFKILGTVSQIQIEIDEAYKRSGQSNPYGMQTVDFIFDEQGDAGLKCLDWYGELKKRVPEPHKTMIANTPMFKDDRLLNPLQAADMLAWHIRRQHQFPNEDRKWVFERINPDGVFQYEIDRDQLIKTVHIFNNDVDLANL